MSKLPDVIGRFKIVDRIAQGGMGALYLAWDPTLERQIAIKLLRDDSDELRERFSREAKFVARLRHPRIVTVFDVGEHDGQPFIAMEYVQGNTLADIVRAEAPLRVSVKLKWVEELCDGLGFAHRAGIVHRDVKPANIVVDAEGSIKILDFGIARDGPGRTQAGMLIGSLNYMSPEQVLGNPVDQRSDVFAVGAVLYELLTYRQAFSGGLDSGVLTKILHDAPEPIASMQPELDGDIPRIVERALAKDPEKRYQEIQTMQRDLLKVLRRFDASQTKVGSDLTAVILPPAPIRPTPPARMRREPDRAALERRRAQQIQAHLETARAAMSGGDYESAITACEHALLLDSLHPMATELLEHAIAALDSRRAGEFLAEAERQLEAEALTSAFDLLQQSFDLGETSSKALQLKDALDRARAERERERQRIEAGQRAAEQARELFDSGSFDEAVSAADEALTFLPGDASVLAVRERASAAAEGQRLQRLNERARVTAAEAQRLFAAAEHADALRLLERFDPPHHEDIVRTSDELRKRLKTIQRQVQERLAEASAAVLAHDLDRAATCVREALALEPAHERAREMDQQIADAIRKAALQREAGQRAVDQANGFFEAGSFDEAIQAADEALSLLPDDAGALSVRQRAIAAADAQRVARLNERARTAGEEARRLFASGEHAKAVNLLEGFDPRDHEDIVRTLDELRTLLKTIERQVEEYLADASAAVSAHELDRAAACVREALALERAHPGAQTMERQISDAIREEARQREIAERLERERQQAVAAKLGKAAQTISHHEALVLINEALELDPQREGTLRSFEIRSAALEEERARQRRRNEIDSAYRRIDELIAGDDLDAVEKALNNAEDGNDARMALQPLRRQLASKRRDIARRELAAVRQREREQAIAEALDRANRAVSHEVAVAAYREVLHLDSGHQLAQQGLRARQGALEKERLIAAALDRASASDSDSEAVRALREALELQPDLPDVLRQLEEREAALARQQEEARQKRHDEAIAGRIARVAAMSSHTAALVELRKILDFDTGNAEAQRLCDLRELALKAEQEAYDQRHETTAGEMGAPQADAEDEITVDVGSPDETGRIPASSSDAVSRWLSVHSPDRRRAYILGAVAAIVLIVALLSNRPNTTETVSPDSAKPASAPTRIDPQPPTTAPPAPVLPNPEPPLVPKAGDTPTTPVDPRAEMEQRLSPIRVVARRQLQQGNDRQAFDTIMSGLKLQPDDAILRRMLDDMALNAIAAARVARDSAMSAGAENLPVYRDGRIKEQEGLRLAPHRPEVALNALWDAASTYSQAAAEARKAKPQESPATVPAAPVPTAPSPAQKKVEAAPPAERPPVEPPASRAASTAADEAAIRAVLSGYERGFAARSVQEITRVYPGVNADALANNFKRMRALSVEIIDPKISIAGSAATVICEVRQRYTPNVGSGGESTINALFRLRKTGDAWVIVERR